MGRRAANPRRRTALAAVALAITTSTGCSLIDADPFSNAGELRPERPRKTFNIEPGSVMEALSPLTGQRMNGVPNHPVVVVKMDNSFASAPQLGLRGADLVVEELVEGGITRLAVFYDRKIPQVVGPVRSVRATDIGVLKPAKALLVTSGGAEVTLQRIRKARIPLFQEGEPGFFREPSRYAPYNLMMRLPEFIRQHRGGPRVAQYMPFGNLARFPDGEPASAFNVTFSPAQTTQWVYDSGRYINTNTNAAEGQEYRPATVITLRVKVRDAGYTDPAGYPVPETVFSGDGYGRIFHGGRAVGIKWSKAGFGRMLKFSHAGKPVKIPPGKVWIELVPDVGGDVSILN